MPISAEQREQRQQAILKILRRQHVTRQEELVELLRKRGIEATQSSISRDLRQLGITKLDQEYRPVTGGRGRRTRGATWPCWRSSWKRPARPAPTRPW